MAFRQGHKQSGSAWRHCGSLQGWGNDVLRAPTEWDRLLGRLELSEADAIAVLAGTKEGPRGSLAQWVRQHYGRKFVPERVLGLLGCQDTEPDVWTEERRMAARLAGLETWARRHYPVVPGGKGK